MKDNLDFIRFQTWHLKLFKPGKSYKPAITDPNVRAAHYDFVEGVTVLLGNEIIGILGIVELWDGVAEVTMVPSDKFYALKKSMLKVSRDLIALAFDTFSLHRLQAMTLASEPSHGRFMEALGFSLEGTLNAYGAERQTVHMYAKVRI